LPERVGSVTLTDVRALSRPWLVVAAVGLSLTLHLSDGFYHQPTLPWLGLSLVAALLGVTGARWPWGAAAECDGTLTRGLLAAGVLVSAVALVTKPLARYMADPRPWAHPDLLLAVALGTAVTIGARVSRDSARWKPLAAVLLAVGLWLGVWAVRQSPHPHIDVIPVHEQAFHSLARGKSPYAITFADIYRANESFYAEGMRDGNRVLFGFPYPPLSLLMAWPGHAALGDLRYSEVAALVLAAALIVTMGSVESVLCAGALLLAPRLMFQLEQGWTEPFPILLLALTVWVALRRPAVAWLPLGLLMASKQHMALGLAFAPMLVLSQSNRHVFAFMAKAVGVTALVTVPFALLDLDAFIRSAVLLQFREPFRLDSLSFTRELVQFGFALDKHGALAVSLSAGALGIVLSWWRAPRTPAGFAASLAITLFLLTAFGKKAFLNYYFLVMAFLLVAIAASGRKTDETGCARASKAAGSMRPQ
jgi:hypothetical protein